jgi:hypothetical protein
MSKNPPHYIQVTLTPEQAGVVVDALDLLSRIHIGQFHTISEQFFEKLLDSDAIIRMENCLLEARQEVFPELTGPGHSHSMTGEKVAEAGKVSWDILQVVRNASAFAGNPEGGHTVDFNDPMFVSKSVPRPVANSVSILDRLADA